MGTSTCLYHFILLNWYIFLNYYIPQLGAIFQDGAQSKYLTLLNLAVFFGVAFLDDVLKRIKKRKDIKFITAFRDLFFATLAFPIGTFVFLAFWTIYLYDRELIYPKTLDGIFPVWVNHAMHSFILLFLLIEIILRPHHYPSKTTGFILLAVGSIGYIWRILWLYSKTGHWVYPVLEKLSPVGLAAFFFLSYISTVSFFLLGERLNHWKWGNRMLRTVKME